MSAYRKRARAQWRQGKGHKRQSARDERQFSRAEIRQQMSEAEDKYLDRYRKGKRTRNERARLEYRIRWCEERIAYWEKHGTARGYWTFYRTYLAEAQRDLKKLEEKGQV